MCWICDDDIQDGGDGQVFCCQCGKAICFDIPYPGDDFLVPAYATSSGDLYCWQCGMSHDKAEEEEERLRRREMTQLRHQGLTTVNPCRRCYRQMMVMNLTTLLNGLSTTS